MWFILGLFAGVIALVYTWLAWNFNYWKNREIPGPKGHLLTGSFPKSFMQKVNIVYDFDEAYK